MSAPKLRGHAAAYRRTHPAPISTIVDADVRDFSELSQWELAIDSSNSVVLSHAVDGVAKQYQRWFGWTSSQRTLMCCSVKGRRRILYDVEKEWERLTRRHTGHWPYRNDFILYCWLMYHRSAKPVGKDRTSRPMGSLRVVEEWPSVNPIRSERVTRHASRIPRNRKKTTPKTEAE